MKIILSSSVLKRAVGFVMGAVKSNPIVPVLENIHFTLENGFLTLRASDLQVTATTIVPIESIGESGMFLLPAQKLAQLLGTLPEGPLTIIIDNQTYGHQIKWATGKSKLTGENPIDFPKITELSKDAFSVSLDENDRSKFINALGSVVWGVSKDDLRPAMTGVYMHPTDDALMLVATNGHHLARQSIVLPDTEEAKPVILPASFARMLIKASAGLDKSYGLELQMSSANVRVQIGDDTLIGRLIDSKFPDYINAIPVDNDKVLKVERQLFIDSLKRVNLTADSQVRVKLAMSKGMATLHTEDMDFGIESDETLTAEYDQDVFHIGFHGGNLLNVISHIDAEMISISMKARNRAALIWGDNEAASTLLMPSALIGDY